MKRGKKFELGPRQKAWVAALRSGKYAQGRCYLVRTDVDRTYHCCLGVLAEMAVADGVPVVVKTTGKGTKTFDRHESTLPHSIMGYCGITSPSGTYGTDVESLTELNDKDVPFDKIADLIEDRASVLFTASL